MSDCTITRAVRLLFPPQVATAVSRIGRDHALWPGEAIKAIPHRQAEFAAGRTAARAAMFRLGLPPVAIPMRPDRAPQWPSGIVGSISHSAGVALAAVAHRRDLTSLGIDIERDSAVEPALWPAICRPEELALLHSMSAPDALVAATALFCAKEASYKAQYPLTGHDFDFDRLSVSFDGLRFAARFTQDTGLFPKGRAIEGRVGRVSGYMLAAVTLTAM